MLGRTGCRKNLESSFFWGDFLQSRKRGFLNKSVDFANWPTMGELQRHSNLSFHSFLREQEEEGGEEEKHERELSSAAEAAASIFT